MLRGSKNSCVASNTFVAGLTNARRLGSVIAYMELAYGIQFFEPLDLAHPSVSGGLLVPMSVRLTPLLCLSFVLVPGLPIRSMTLSLADVRLLEQRLMQSLTSHRSAQHDRDRQLVFRDVARPSAEPVESILHKVEVRVSCVDHADCAVEFESPVQLDPSQPLWISGHAHDIVHAEHDKAWLQDVSEVHAQDPCVQSQLVGDLQTLFEAFHEQWRRRWCKHDGVPF